MKLNKVVAVCKAVKTAHLIAKLDEGGTISRQFVSDRKAVYPMDGLPLLDETSILSVFDIPKDKHSEWLTKCEDMNSSPFLTADLADNDESDAAIYSTGMLINYNDVAMIPYFTPYGVVFVDVNHIKPLADEGDSLEFFARQTIAVTMVVAKTGFLLVAAIAPLNVFSGDFVDKLSTIASSLDLEYARRRNASQGEEPGARESRQSLPTGQALLPEYASKTLNEFFGDEDQDAEEDQNDGP